MRGDRGMQAKLKDIKRKQICPILFRRDWDYKGQDPDSEFFRFCITEMMRWQYRKGRGISYDVLSSLISRLAAEKGIDRQKVSEIQLALKSFTNSGLYSRIDELICNAEIQVGIKDGHVITHTIPALSKINDNTCIITWDDRFRTAEDLKQSYETRLTSVWSFYSLNKYPLFYNLYLNGAKVDYVRYKPNQFYIRDSRDFFLNMKELIEQEKIYPAPVEVCVRCDRRHECQTSRTRTKNWQKSW
jgi:hypothetical protein